MTTSRKAFLDTNVLVYTVVLDDPRAARATELVRDGCQFSIPVIGEFVTVARRKLKFPWSRIDMALAELATFCPRPAPLEWPTFLDARRIAEQYGYHLYDSQVIAAALSAGSQTLWSEDMQDGQLIDGRLTIRNPFRVN